MLELAWVCSALWVVTSVAFFYLLRSRKDHRKQMAHRLGRLSLVLMLATAVLWVVSDVQDNGWGHAASSSWSSAIGGLAGGLLVIGILKSRHSRGRSDRE